MDPNTLMFMLAKVSKAHTSEECRSYKKKKKKIKSVFTKKTPQNDRCVKSWIHPRVLLPALKNTDVNCGGGWRARALIMRCLHSDLQFLWRRLHSVAVRLWFMIRPNVMQKPQQRSQLEASQAVVHSIAIYINEMTAAKGRFIVLFFWDHASTVRY